MTSPLLAEKTGLSSPTVNAALTYLVNLGILEEITGRQRGRVYAYQGYLDILSEGTESPPLRGTT